MRFQLINYNPPKLKFLFLKCWFWKYINIFQPKGSENIPFKSKDALFLFSKNIRPDIRHKSGKIRQVPDILIRHKPFLNRFFVRLWQQANICEHRNLQFPQLKSPLKWGIYSLSRAKLNKRLPLKSRDRMLFHMMDGYHGKGGEYKQTPSREFWNKVFKIPTGEGGIYSRRK